MSQQNDPHPGKHIYEAARVGDPQAQIPARARELGHDVNTIPSTVPSPAVNEVLTPEELERDNRIREGYPTCRSTSAFAKSVGYTSRSALYTRASQLGVRRQKRSSRSRNSERYSRHRSRYNDEENITIIRLAELGRSNDEIALVLRRYPEDIRDRRAELKRDLYCYEITSGWAGPA